MLFQHKQFKDRGSHDAGRVSGKGTRRAFLWGSILSLVLLNFQPVSANASGILPPNVEPLKIWDLRKIYVDRTWVWKNGGGRFEDKGHRFIAWSSENGVSSYAEGRWSVNDSGVLCFDAVWTAKNGSGPAKTCFEHVRDRGTIYQRRLPDGEWYIFRHFRPKASDEIQKLVRKDTVSGNVERLEKRFN